MKTTVPARTMDGSWPIVAAQLPSISMREVISAYVELTKPRITSLIVLTAAAGFGVGSRGSADYLSLLHTVVGIGLLAAGVGALNQYLERDIDGLMRRTESRPLPSGKLRPANALVFGSLLSALAIGYMAAFLGLLTAFLGLLALAGYLFVYTPLKTRSWLCTAVGALPGALPPLIGWTAARGYVGLEAWVLFAIVFLWQFPHFLSIAWLYREDYERGGIKMLPVIEPDGKTTGRQIVIYALALVPVSLLPALLGMSGSLYLWGAGLLSLAFLYFSLRAAVVKSKWQARQLLLSSVVYLPLLFALMVFNRG